MISSSKFSKKKPSDLTCTFPQSELLKSSPQGSLTRFSVLSILCKLVDGSRLVQIQVSYVAFSVFIRRVGCLFGLGCVCDVSSPSNNSLGAVKRKS